MILLKPDMPPADLKDKKLVFLAGPIMGAENWQARAAADLADLDVYVADPRREKSENFDYDSQVGWESFYLSRADVVMFWLPLAAAFRRSSSNSTERVFSSFFLPARIYMVSSL